MNCRGMLDRVMVAVSALVVSSAATAASLVEIPDGATAAEVQQAIDSVDDGGTVRFGAGTWTLDATLVLSRGVTVEGAGAAATTLDFNNACRGFKLSNAAAVVADLKICQGKVTDGEGGGVHMTAGAVRDCCIASGLAHGSATGKANKGGGVYMTGGTVDGCEIVGCKCDNLYGLGNAIYMTGGTVTGCDIHGNDGGYSHSTPAYGGAVIYMYKGGTVENSKIHHNDKETNPGIHAYKGGCVVRNCLIYGNTGKNKQNKSYGAGGVYLEKNNDSAGGTVQYCTIHGNAMAGDETGRSGIWSDGGTVQNSILWGNGPAGGTAGSCEVKSGAAPTISNNVLDKALEGYAGNTVGDPLFADAANGDFTICTKSSAAYGYATPLAAVTTDIVGSPRDETAPTCGAYELALPVENPVFAPASGTPFSSSLDVTLSCATDGATIRYTTDGGDPTEQSAAYGGAITVSGATTTVKARAFKAGLPPSDIVSATYPYSGEVIRVTSTGEAYGTVEPDYGEDGSPEVDRVYVFTCMEDVDVLVENAKRAVCTGWKLYDGDRVLKSSTDAGEEKLVCRYAFQQGQRLTLEWQWQVEYAVSASAPAGQGTVSGGGWVAEGAPVTLTVAAADNWAFTRWAGDVPVGRETENPLCFASVTNALTLNAVIVGSVQLKPGDDVPAVIGTLTPGSTAALAEGTYTLSNTLVFSNGVTVTGAGADKTVLDFQKLCRGVEMTSADATLEGVTIKQGKVTGHGGGVSMTAGTVRNCRITGCIASGNFNCGGGIYIKGGLAVGCEIDGCLFDSLYGHGNGLYQDGGTVTGCDIHQNDGGYSHSGGYGDAVVYLKSGTLAATKIHDNTKEATAGVHQENGTMANCLVYRNTCSKGNNTYGSAGILKTNGNTYNCTVYNCVRVGDTTGESGLKQSNGTTKNCIFWACAPEESTAGSVSKSGGTFENNVTEVAVTTDTLTGDPAFVNVETNDFRIGRASSAFQTGLVLADVTTDFAGAARDAEHPCVGAYEYDPSTEVFEVNLRFDRGQYPAGASVVVEAIVSGVGEAVLPVAWTVDGTLLPDTGNTITLENLAPGVHTVSATVVHGDDVATKERAFTLLPTKVYVNRTGSAAYPYATEETGTSSISAAVAALYSASDVTNEVEIAAGEYTNATTVAFMTPVRVFGAGREVTKVVCETPVTAFQLDNSDANLADLTVSNAFHGVSLVKGTVRRCRFEDCLCDVGADSEFGAGVTMSGGLVADCLFERCVAKGTYVGGGGAYVSGGVLSNCVFRRCGAESATTVRGGGAVCVESGAVSAALVTDCRIEESSGKIYPAFHVKGGNAILRNTYVSGSAAGTTELACLESGLVESCTIARNAVAEGKCPVLATSGMLLNTVIWDNLGGEATNAIFAARHSCFAGAAHGVDGNTTNAPLLRASGRLFPSSPCRDAGELQPWMTGALDLLGNPRVIGGKVDMGAFETKNSGILLLVR